MWMALAYVALVVVGGTCVLSVYFKRKSDSSVAGTHVVVTGGSQGLGKQLAETYFRRGAKVTIMARTESKLIKAKDEINAIQTTGSAPQSSSIEYVVCDVTDFEKVSSAMAKAVQVQGGAPIHTLICSAGLAKTGYFLDLSTDDFKNQMLLNYMGPVNCVKAVAPAMIRQGQR